jgi:hypothetical protein
MQWRKEEAFRALLHKIAIKATVERLARAADMALEKDEAGVKIVSKLILRELKNLKPAYKLRIFYAFSSIVRASVAKYGSRSKYADRWGVKLDTVAGLLAEIPPSDKILVGRVLHLWWRDGIFSPRSLTKLQTQYPASPTPNTTSTKKLSHKSGHDTKNKNLAGSSSTSVEKMLKYWDEELGTEVIITSASKTQDAPASPDRNVDKAPLEQSPIDESPLPVVSDPVVVVTSDYP